MPELQLTVIVPCFNERAGIESSVETLARDLAPIQDFEILLVDDGSTDGSSEIIEALAQRMPGLRVVRHARNRGYGAALKTGIRRARGEWIAITDADDTYPSERLPELIELARECDMVVGARTEEGAEHPTLRRIPKWFLRRYASWIVGEAIPDLNSGMRVFRKSIAERFFRILPDTFSFTSTITIAMMRNRFDVRFVPIAYNARSGHSKIKPLRDTLRFTMLVVRTGMYFAPLRVLMPIASVLMLLFLASAAYDVFVRQNLADTSVLLLLFALNTMLFALLADMIDKRGSV